MILYVYGKHSIYIILHMDSPTIVGAKEHGGRGCPDPPPPFINKGGPDIFILANIYKII